MLRPAVAEDAGAVAAVHARAGRAAWSAFLGDVLAEPEVDTWRERLAEPAFLVAERTGRVVGFARADERTGEVAYLYVDPDEQGRGTGRQLLAAVLDRLRTAGHRRARLRTEERNAGPRRFYASAGWRLTGEVLEREWRGRRLRELWYELDLD
ncbi:GNAT family N-acetyltransferase [Geodermatophilus sabuli]|uniref:L-amino acid N-acyltransferase YncA n=1 Tax=Geodermatophilus sabuli TaxID=1564158 RepID=A0A285E769_9ACTN|nr:GNAT family N-acetyltransferase [Geodermatophilus sabuli]MBB3082330.1 GNAT superfamily N-acetyltransferase [Geodermatophilus sabuli]SNX94800.1 L-amino acid N-acyltransferase YncA [Geodermatophilus sabuli]